MDLVNSLCSYHKHTKFRGVINFVVFADATIPQNLILAWWVAINPYKEFQVNQQFTQLYWYSYRFNITQNIVLTADRIGFLRRLEILYSALNS